MRYLATVPDERGCSSSEAAGKRTIAATAPSGQSVRRLTHSQYNNTIRDLLGGRTRPADRFPPEDFVNGFKNQFSVQGMPPLLVEAYSRSAERLALNAFRAGDVNGLIPCKPASAEDAACRDRFLKQFGERAFRRPLTDAEVRRYSTLFTTQAKVNGKFLEGARVVVEAMLQSPKFLFHLETGPDGTLRDYGIASRLSFLLWDSMPDQALLHAAASGELRTSAGIGKNARRMLDDPRARQSLHEFFDEWFRLERVVSAVKDAPVYPQFTPALAAMMVDETHRLLDDLVWSDRDFTQAFTADYAFLNPELTALYGIPSPTGEFHKVIFPAGSRRAGLLGEASFLTATAGPVETSPTSRGLFVREQLLCQHVPSPPPGVNTNLPELDPNKPLSRQQRLLAHVEDQSCASCHRLMDPIGLGSRAFRWRSAVGAKKNMSGGPASLLPAIPLRPKKNKPGNSTWISTRTEMWPGIANAAFSDPVELGRILAASPICQQCVVRQIFRYASGRMEAPGDRPTIDHLYDKFKASGFRFRGNALADGAPGRDAGVPGRFAAKSQFGAASDTSSGDKYGPQ